MSATTSAEVSAMFFTASAIIPVVVTINSFFFFWGALSEQEKMDPEKTMKNIVNRV
ncbi:hypothetical protein MYP_4040 [Sporocytophaga myxococcoides]|uniref:Uncharacterized protein n=1 Tax=Sporocytophaga myxococcoides TaxID=153721 RepID=A0A098LIP1_9BACT|nr:hypothetical protein MYP_4040 [Sporocytophaga myxococcoides]